MRNLALQFNWNDMNKNNRLSYNIRILDDMCQLIFKNVWYIKREINLEGKEMKTMNIIFIVLLDVSKGLLIYMNGQMEKYGCINSKN